MTDPLPSGLSPVSHRQNGGAGRIAGITLTHISDDPPRGYDAAQQGHIGALERRYIYTQQHFEEVKFKPEQRGIWDDRVSELIVGDDVTFKPPIYSFLISKSLLAKIKATRDKKGADVSQNELLALCLAAGEDAVDTNFSANAMNSINASYYSSDMAFSESSGLADVFVKNRPLNIALGRLLASRMNAADTMRIKALSSGTSIKHWEYIANGLASSGITKAEVVLTDFMAPPVTTLSIPGLVIQSEPYSLLDEMPSLPKDKRFDAFLITYGFDSVWQPEDLSLKRVGDQWYQRLYRIKVADWNPRRKELITAMRQGQPLIHAHPHDYDGIVVETAMEAIDISAHPFAEHIMKSGRTSLNFPGGMIKRVVNAVTTQVKDNGLFIIGDTGNFGFSDPFDSPASDRAISGVAARYRSDDYLIAQEILEKDFGLSVSIMNLDELATRYLLGEWIASASKTEVERISKNSKTGIMVVSRAAK
jgi:hypothetical protein